MPVEPEVKAAVEAVAKWFAGEGAIVEPVVPVMSRAILDGLDSFFRARSWGDIEPLPAAERAKIHPYTRKWAEGGAKLSGVEAIRGFNQSMVLRTAAALLFGRIDYLISPTAPIPAFAAERASPHDDPEHPFEHIAFTVPWNFTEQPAISINAAFTKSGLPIGVQIIGRRFDDHGVLRMAKAWETARGRITNWPTPPPPPPHRRASARDPQQRRDRMQVIRNGNAFRAHRVGGGQQIRHHDRHHAGRMRRSDAVMRVFQRQAVGRRDTEPRRRHKERIRRGLRIFHILARDDYGEIREQLRAGGDDPRPTHAVTRSQAQAECPLRQGT